MQIYCRYNIGHTRPPFGRIQNVLEGTNCIILYFVIFTTVIRFGFLEDDILLLITLSLHVPTTIIVTLHCAYTGT